VLLPREFSALRGPLERWFEEQGVRPCVAGEFDDSALLKAFGQRDQREEGLPGAGRSQADAHGLFCGEPDGAGVRDEEEVQREEEPAASSGGRSRPPRRESGTRHGSTSFPNRRAWPMTLPAVTAYSGVIGSPADRSALAVQVLQVLRRKYLSRAT